MTLVFEAPTISLRTDAHGVVRISNTRVRLETIIYAFNQGHTAEDIMSKFPVLNLADIYTVIAYYLNNRVEVDAYIQKQLEEAEELRQEIEEKPEYKLFRERLLARYQTHTNNPK